MLEIKLNICLPRIYLVINRLISFIFFHLSFNINLKRRVPIFVVFVLWNIPWWVNIFIAVLSCARESIPVETSNSPTTTMISSTAGQYSDFNRSPRRGRTRSRTSRERQSKHVHGVVLTRGFSSRKASKRTVHEYEQTDAPRWEKPGGWRLPQRPERRISEEGWSQSASLSPDASRGELT